MKEQEARSKPQGVWDLGPWTGEGGGGGEQGTVNLGGPNTLRKVHRNIRKGTTVWEMAKGACGTAVQTRGIQGKKGGATRGKKGGGTNNNTGGQGKLTRMHNQ